MNCPQTRMYVATSQIQAVQDLRPIRQCRQNADPVYIDKINKWLKHHLDPLPRYIPRPINTPRYPRHEYRLSPWTKHPNRRPSSPGHRIPQSNVSKCLYTFWCHHTLVYAEFYTKHRTMCQWRKIPTRTQVKSRILYNLILPWLLVYAWNYLNGTNPLPGMEETVRFVRYIDESLLNFP